MLSSRIGIANLYSLKVIRSVSFGMAFAKGREDDVKKLKQKYKFYDKGLIEHRMFMQYSGHMRRTNSTSHL